MSSLATILVNRLVLNLRERAVNQLPTTVETAGRFQAALPDGPMAATINDTRSTSSTREAVGSLLTRVS
jgi:hypothetical protein